MKDYKFPENLVDLANYLITLKKYTDAEHLCDLSLTLKPEYSRSYKYKRLNTCETNNYVKAQSDFDKAVKLDPDNAEYINNRGVAKSLLKDVSGAEV